MKMMGAGQTGKNGFNGQGAGLTPSHMITRRLDEGIPLQTPEWKKVEQLLMQLTEFAPHSLVSEVVNAMAIYADDQAHRGYVLGQEDAIASLSQKKVA